MQISAAGIIRFWIDEIGPPGWYAEDDALDARIRARFEAPWRAGLEAGAAPFGGGAEDALAALILFDQFPRNMFRGRAEAFATDPLALDLARAAIDADLDTRIDLPARQFFFLPFMHSEDLAVQDAGIDLIASRLGMADTHLHARAHRAVIARFGRFPYRNAALGRQNSAEEQAFLDAGGYGAILRQVQDA